MLVITEKPTPLVRFAWLFYNQTFFQKFECTFFDQVAIDAKSENNRLFISRLMMLIHWRGLLEMFMNYKSTSIWIPAIHGAKTTKNQTPLVRFAWLFHNQIVFQRFEHSFFDQVVIDAKNV